MRTPKSWRERDKRTPEPWTEAEDERVIDIANCGVALCFAMDFLPDRTFGEIVERRLQLREAGRAGFPTPL